MTRGEPLTAIFLAELEERARALGRDLLALERQPPGPARGGLVNSLFRTAHSLKGAAGAVGIAEVELVCHHLEEIFAAARESRLEFDSELFRLAFSCVDAIEESGKILRRGDSLAGSGLERMFPSLEAAIGHAMEAAPSAHPMESSLEPQSDPIAQAREEPMVRVAAQRLDAIVARSSELPTLRARADVRLAELEGLRASLRRCLTEWTALVRQTPRTGRRGPADEHTERVRHYRADRGEDTAASHGRALRSILAECDRLSAALAEDRRALDQVIGPLDTEIRRTRLIPFATACDGLERLVRDLSRAVGKQAELVVTGGELELDRAVIQRLRDPLIHLVRNAIDHGVEHAAERKIRGKPANGRIEVSAAIAGTMVAVAVADDGAGLDLAAIRQRARGLGLVEAEGAELVARIFLPGFSTQPAVTSVSGRGVGLDAVKNAAESMRGFVDVSHESGRGTRFVVSLPLTLSTFRALMLRAGKDIFAIEGAHIERLLLAEPDMLGSVEGRTVLLVDEATIPVVALADLFGIESDRQADQRSLPVVLLRLGRRRLGLVVDEFLGEQEVVVRSLGPRLDGLKHVSGGTILATGNVALILNVADLFRDALSGAAMSLPIATEDDAAPARKKHVLLVDDSLTTRTLERSILEMAGYEVTIAADGDEAWQLLIESGADIVVSDVDMPRMDGFALTEAIRNSARFGRLPVVLVTARENADDKARGMTAGADSYLVKSAFDQKSLLDAIARLL